MSLQADAVSTSDTYELLVELLIKCPQTVEILPGDGTLWTSTQSLDDIGSDPSIGPFLFIEGNLGIPQKILYKLYLYAVGVFKSARIYLPTLLTTVVPDLDSSVIRTLTASSSVLILANPSHQTALNVRKYLVRTHAINPDDELHFTASLLSSQHCAKHAELWHHRRWLLSTAYDTQPSVPAGVDPYCRLHFASQGAVRQELTLLSRACELYPRNYFAWTHRLICMRTLLLDYLTGMDTIGFVRIFREEFAEIKGWIDRHVSDYSAIHFVLSLSRTVFLSGNQSLSNIVIGEDLLDHAISRVQEYPTHETLWMYIRAALCIPDPRNAQKIQQFIDHFVQPLECSPHKNHGKASQYAKQFLDRRYHASIVV